MSTSTSAKATIDVFNNYCHRFGYPSTVMSDNGPQFRSSDFQQYCAKRGIKQCFAPPFQPQCNGQVERLVDSFKRNMQKHNWSSEGLQTWLLAYRTTPMEALQGRTPSEIFLGRKPRTLLSILKPRPTPPIQKESHYSSKMSKQFNTKHGVKAVNFVVGTPVFVLNYRHNNAYWLPGRVSGFKGSRTFTVFVPILNATVHRHANQLRLRPEDYETVEPAAGRGEEDFQHPIPVPDNEHQNNNQNNDQPAEQQPRRSSRHRQPTVKFDIDPKKKSYKNN
jgi:hypothetical protein